MKKVEAIIRTERLPAVKEALKVLGIRGMTIFSVSGWSKGIEETLQWKGHPVPHDLIAKSKLEIIVANDTVDIVIDTIAKKARTGVHGDGIIIVTAVEQGVNILTMEMGDDIIK